MSFPFADCATGAQRFRVSARQSALCGLRFLPPPPPQHPLLSHIRHTVPTCWSFPPFPLWEAVNEGENVQHSSS